MAIQAALFVPAAKDGATTTLAGTTASSAIVIGLDSIFILNATQAVTITFGNSGGTAAATPSATVGLYVPAGASFTFGLSAQYDSFKIFNTSATTATYSYLQLSRF